jgi:hypothetical protein
MLRFRGNEFVTDQVLNRSVYRLFRNDVYLDDLLKTHIENDLIHNMATEEGSDGLLTGDRLVILACTQREDVVDEVGTITTFGWQNLINSQPKNLGGNTLVFRIMPTLKNAAKLNDRIFVHVLETLKFNNFFGGTLIIEGPHVSDEIDDSVSGSATEGQSGVTTEDDDATPSKIRIILTSNFEDTSRGLDNLDNLIVPSKPVSAYQYGGTEGAVISLNNCKCHVILRNCWLAQCGIGTDPAMISGSNTINFVARGAAYSNYKKDGLIYGNWGLSSEVDEDTGNEITQESQIEGLKRYVEDRFLDMNITSALRLTDCPDVYITNCYFTN